MHLRDRLSALALRPHLPRRTVRLRLTLLYGALFLLSGAGLLAITYVLVRNTTGGVSFAKGPNGRGAVFGSPSGSTTNRQVLHGSGLTAPQLQALAAQLHAQSVQQHTTELHQLLVNSGIALGAMLVASIALGWIIAGRVLRPLHTITTAAREISVSNLDARLALDGPNDELKELGDTFDGLLERLDAAFRSQRQFVANASHELRSPLARQRTVGQVALRDPQATVESLRAVVERILAAGRQQERLIDALLTLSRGQAGLDRSELFDLATIVEHVVALRQEEAERRGLVIDITLSSAPTVGDPRLVERLVVNLVDNTLRYNVDYGHIDLVTATKDGAAVLAVTNTGPLVPASAIDRLRQPFQRFGPERTGHGEGLGLGLSIVDAITSAHGGTLTLCARPSGGLEVTVRLPIATSFAVTHRSSGDPPKVLAPSTRSPVNGRIGRRWLLPEASRRGAGDHMKPW